MFGVRRKKKRGDGDQDVNFSLMVTPMLDMTFQLLAFFIITFKPTPMEGQMSLMLAADKAQGGAVAEKPPEKEAKPKLDLAVIVASENGGIDRLQVRNGNDVKDVKGGLDALTGYLQNLRKEYPELGRYNGPDDADPNRQQEITLEASSKLQYSNLIGVMDVCLKTGFGKPAFGPPPDLPGGGK